MKFLNAKWIWINETGAEDEYGEFFDIFDYVSGRAVVGISCDGNYALYINDKMYNTSDGLAAFGQYADFPWYKVYDEIDITKFLTVGRNELRIVVWHYGADFTSTYYNAPACLIYDVQVDNESVVYSSEKTLCRLACGYVSGAKKRITQQLGYSFRYDARLGNNEVKNAVVNESLCYTLYPRPIKKLELKPLISGRLIDKEKRIYDLWRENVGLLYIRFKAPAGENVTISYGEHIEDGEVRRKIDKRDFSVEIIGSGRTEEYLNPFRRLGCRYLQVDASENTIIEEIGLHETLYPVTERPYAAENPLHQNIYDIAVRTLRLCMHEHYEDTPWREQAMYALDSRNQMLFGSAAFEDGLEFQRASLKLMAKDRRADGLLSICAPSSVNFAIPSFSLWFVIAMSEYTVRTGDTTLAEEYYVKLSSIIHVFSERLENGLVRNFNKQSQEVYWDFYEWSEGLYKACDCNFDAALQVIFSIALQEMAAVCRSLKKQTQADEYIHQAETLNAAINARFWRSDKGLYDTFGDGNHYSELVNALAILCGAATGSRADKICAELVTKENVVKSTLSMLCFTYDALIKVDKGGFSDYIIQDIDARYGRMLAAGATSFWETEEGEKAFQNAGSLCHGWSAAPVYYYRLLLADKKSKKSAGD